MSSLSSRFSTLTSASSKPYHPPKPSFKSPKLVQEPQHAAWISQDLSRIAHPFANPGYATPRRDPPLPVHQDSSPIRQETYSHIPTISEFGSFHSDFDPPSTADRPASAGPHESTVAPQTRERSNTVASTRSACPEYCPPVDFLPSPNPFKSQFDDSDDEEKLDFAIQSLAGVSNRARLAAIGTASRLFKSKHHSRTPSKAGPLESGLQFDKAGAQSRSPPAAARPCTSDGMSPNPRQAVFCHRPSPSELSLPDQRNRSRSIAPADRDLILALQGGGSKPRTKQTDKNTSLPRPPPPIDQHRSSHFRKTSLNISAPFTTDARSHWMMDPPPYCAPSESELVRGDNLRKSQSLSTLRFGFNRRPSSGCSPLPEATCQSASEQVERLAPPASDQSAWEAMLTMSPSSMSDHGSLSSGGRNTRSEASPQTPSKRIAKANRLPPQKPPPQRCLPPSPPSQQHVSSAMSPLEEDQPCPSSADESISGNSALVASRDKIYTLQNSAQTSLDVSLPATARTSPTYVPTKVDNSSPPPKSPPQATNASLGRSRPLDHHMQVVLDIGGTKFVTLVSTLQGASGDQPRLLELLQQRQHSDEAALCSSTQLTRPRRVDTSNRPVGRGERFDTDTCTPASPSHPDAELRNALSTLTCKTDLSCSTPLFIDRNADLYRDILDILRSHKLPYRLQASCLAHSSEPALRLQLRCRLWEVKDEAAWLGYGSIVGMCEAEIGQV